MALNNFLGFLSNCFEIDYMLENMFLGIYLLLIFLFVRYYLSYFIDLNIYFLNFIRKYLKISSQNNKIDPSGANKGTFRSPVSVKFYKSIKFSNIQSAENCTIRSNIFKSNNSNKGFSETIRRLFSTCSKQSSKPLMGELSTFGDINSLDNDLYFWKWFAGILDGNGNFDLRKLDKMILKEIKIKIHNRDIRILTRIQNKLHLGKIRLDKNKPYTTLCITKHKDLIYILNNVNGLIRLKADLFKKSCDSMSIDYIEANYNIELNDPYLSGLIDTKGSIIYNYTENRIECNLSIKYNEYSSKLNLDNTIFNYIPSKSIQKSNSSDRNTIYKTITFKYQTVKGMIYLYDYFMKNRLYSDLKFYRVSKIKYFIEIRSYKKEPKDSIEYKVYKNFILGWIQYKNPKWNKTPFISKLNK